jgi:hypothetical protein
MSSIHWVWFLLNALSLKCYMIHFHHQTTFKVFLSLVILKHSGTQQNSYKHSWYMKNPFLPSVFHEYLFLLLLCNYRLSTVSHFKPTQIKSPQMLFGTENSIIHHVYITSNLSWIEGGSCFMPVFYVVCMLIAHSKIKGYTEWQLYTQAI